jgi:carbonic anhydrase
VHRDAAGNLLVLAILIEEGTANPAFDALIANLPSVGDAAKTIAGPFDPETLLPADRDYWAYNASLTTPPASEGVSFAIFSTPIQLSTAQIAAIDAAIGEPNARPVQPVNDRPVFVDIA